MTTMIAPAAPTAVALPAQARAEIESDLAHRPALSLFVSGLRMSRDWREVGAAIVSGLPTEPELAERALLAVSRLLGPMLPQDGRGALVRQVRYRGLSIAGSGTGRYSDSKDGGDWHTDGPHLPAEPPAAFVLLCVRQAGEGGELQLIDSAQVVGQLRPDTVAVLQQPFHFDQREQGAPPVPRPVLTRTFDGWQLAYLREYIESGHRLPGVPELTGPQRRALDDLDRVIRAKAEDTRQHHEVKLCPGELVIVDNRSLIHGRRAFVADHTDRLMLRTWIGDRT